jgi:hypothetical protein
MGTETPPTVTLHVNKAFQPVNADSKRTHCDEGECLNRAAWAEWILDALLNCGVTVDEFLNSVLRGNIKDKQRAAELVEDLLDAEHKHKLEKYISVIADCDSADTE